jgi:hypothetical protein
LVEFGTRPRYTKGKGKKRKYRNAFRGVMRKKPFMAPAFESTKALVISSISSQVGMKLLAYMRKTVKR